jgi:hypothetical protein
MPRAAILTITILFTACASTVDPEDAKTDQDLGVAIPHLRAVSEAKGYDFLTAGGYKGGTAIQMHVESFPSDAQPNAAYWVRDEILYTVNELARKWSPDLPPAPPHVVIDEEFMRASSP